MFRSGDHVRHEPSGQEWVLAFGDLEDGGGRVSPAGWPAGLAEASDCALLKAASDDEHMDMLRRVAEIRGDHGADFRATRAQRYLQSLPNEGNHNGND